MCYRCDAFFVRSVNLYSHVKGIVNLKCCNLLCLFCVLDNENLKTYKPIVLWSSTLILHLLLCYITCKRSLICHFSSEQVQSDLPTLQFCIWFYIRFAVTIYICIHQYFYGVIHGSILLWTAKETEVKMNALGNFNVVKRKQCIFSIHGLLLQICPLDCNTYVHKCPLYSYRLFTYYFLNDIGICQELRYSWLRLFFKLTFFPWQSGHHCNQPLINTPGTSFGWIV